MTILSEYNHYFRLPLKSNTGSSPDVPRTILLAEGFAPSADAAYTPSEAERLVSKVNCWSSGSFKTDSDGYAYPTTTWAAQCQTNALPAPGTRHQVYEVWGKSTSSPGTNMIMRSRWNIADGTNYWETAIKWTGTQFQLLVDEITASVWTTRISTSITSSITGACFWRIGWVDAGDDINAWIQIYEKGNPVDDAGYSGSYTVASRPHSSYTNSVHMAGTRGTADGTLRVLGYKVSYL